MATPSSPPTTGSGSAVPQVVLCESLSPLPCFPYGIDFSNKNQREILLEGLTILRIIRGHDLTQVERRTRRMLRDRLKNNTLVLSSHSIDELSWRLLRGGLSCIAQNSCFNGDEEYARMCASLGVCDLWAFTCQRPARIRGHCPDYCEGDQIVRECDFHAGYFSGTWTDPRSLSQSAEEAEDEDNLFDFVNHDHDEREPLPYDDESSDHSVDTDTDTAAPSSPGDKRPLEAGSTLGKRNRK